MIAGLVLTGSIRLERGQLRRPNERDLLCKRVSLLHNAAAGGPYISGPASLPPAPAKAAATGVKTLKKRAKNSAQCVSERASGHEARSRTRLGWPNVCTTKLRLFKKSGHLHTFALVI